MQIVAQTDVDSLTAMAHRKQWKATSGAHGSGSNRHGRGGEDLIIPVPPGTIIRDAEHGFVIKDLARLGDQVTAARGGKGGRGNTHFKSSTNRAPRETTRGELGEARRLVLELKMIADVGLVGLPNAGKSTLLSRLTHARPRIANYPFTTRHPNLGRVDVDRDSGFILADLPGLIEGAHQGVGLGHEFLRHVERTKTLVHLVEPCPTDGSDPCANYETIRQELAQHSSDLARRPELIAVSKGELPEAEAMRGRLAAELQRPVALISAATGVGLRDLVHAMAESLQQAERESE